MLHRRFLFLGILASVPLDLDDQVQEVVVAMGVVDQHDEVGQILPVSEVPVWHFQPQVVILHVGADLWVRFCNATELGLRSLSRTPN